MSSNTISGSLPDSFNILPKLSTLDLDMNTLNGSLPPSLFQSALLVTLHLSNNSFIGAPDFGNTTTLINLIVDHNNFNAITLPINAPLQRLMINDNLISGRLPDLSALSDLKIFNAARNNL
jgi:hypothetical protein